MCGVRNCVRMPFMSLPNRWHPWRHLRDHYPHIDVHFVDLSYRGKRGRLTRRGIEIEQTSNQTERREALVHEMQHYERGPVPKHPYFGPREERAVQRLTAERLVELDALVEALAWCDGEVTCETAEELWVNLDTLETRIRNLTQRERTYIHAELARRQPWNN